MTDESNLNPAVVQSRESTLPELPDDLEDADFDSAEKECAGLVRDGVLQTLAMRERQLLSTIAALTAARAQVPRWISVETELPPNTKDILFIVNGDSEAEKGLYLGKNKWITDRTDGYGEEISFSTEQVICWMLVPPYAAPAKETTA